tara:strand:- start:269 stop:1285 length:1017 start_codon:yes stop_codon:yes gene_type:complete
LKITYANVAQSVERCHGKAEVNGSIPFIGSLKRLLIIQPKMHNADILLQQFCDHSKFIRGYSKYTIRRYQQAIGFYLRSNHVEQLSDVTEENLRQFFLNGRVKRGWSANTCIVYHKSFTVFFRWCKEHGYFDAGEAVVANIELPKLEKRLPPKLTKQDALRLLEVVYNYPYDYHFLRHRNHAIFAMFLYAGLRKGELLNLHVTDVDFENLTIFIRQGKGGKDRIIPMSYTLAQSLKRYEGERKRLRKTCPEFFTSLNRNVGFTDTGIKRLVSKIRTASKINFTIHKLRHTFATLMLEGGCDIYSLSRMMGHSDIKTTTIYLAASAEHLRGQIGKHPLN